MGHAPERPERIDGPGYYGQPILKSPVWTWQVGLYLFAGGAAGMSGVIALSALLTGQPPALVRAAMDAAAAGAVISPVLLVWDLGRPSRFLNMLRVFKWRSAMSMGVWTLVLFGNCAVAGWLLIAAGGPQALLSAALVAGTAVSGAILATYTGVLLGATVVPIWSAHHRLLPFHFGLVGLGSAAAILELRGFHLIPLHAISVLVSALETAIGIWLELDRRSPVAAAAHRGAPGLLLRVAGLLTGPLPLVARLTRATGVAASLFLVGALCSRYGWLLAGRVSAADTAALVAAQRRKME